MADGIFGQDRIFRWNMNKKLIEHYIELLSRIILAAVFLFAGIEKVSDPVLFAEAIAHYNILPEYLVLIVATILPWLELMCAWTLLSGVWLRGGMLIVSFLMFVFTLAVASALLRHLDISCGCFTLDPTAAKIGWMKLTENISLMLLSIYCLHYTGKKM